MYKLLLILLTEIELSCFSFHHINDLNTLTGIITVKIKQHVQVTWIPTYM